MGNVAKPNPEMKLAPLFWVLNRFLTKLEVVNFLTYLVIIRNFRWAGNVIFWVWHQIILLHDHFEGCIEIANPKGQQFFIPRGEAPRDEKLSPEGFSNFIASRKMIVQ